MSRPQPQLADLPDVLTVKEAASLLRISGNSAYDALRTGEIPSVRIGRRYLIPKHALAKSFGMPAAVASEPETTPNEITAADPIDDFCGALARLLRYMCLNPE